MKAENVETSTILLKKFKSDVFLGTFTKDNFENIFELNDRITHSIKNGEKLNDEIFEFLILDFLTTNPIVKDRKIKNFTIINESLLNTKFKCSDSTIEYSFIDKLNLLEKECIFIPIHNAHDGLWHLIIIQNLYKLFDDKFIKNNNIDIPVNDYPAKISIIVFSKLQSVSKVSTKKIIEYFENLLSFYLKHKYKSSKSQYLKNSSGLVSALNNSLIFFKINNFKILEDTGLIVAKIIQDMATEDANLLKAVNTIVIRNFNK
jgi:hypothetical protein